MSDVFVIRVQDIQQARIFFEQLGLSFVEEQHGEGPVHFACERNGKVFEIYPSTSGKSSARFYEAE
jgi:lactoylglutathione lyase